MLGQHQDYATAMMERLRSPYQKSGVWRDHAMAYAQMLALLQLGVKQMQQLWPATWRRSGLQAQGRLPHQDLAGIRQAPLVGAGDSCGTPARGSGTGALGDRAHGLVGVTLHTLQWVRITRTKGPRKGP